MLTSFDVHSVPFIVDKEDDISLYRSHSFIKRIFDVVVSSLVIIFILFWLYPLLGLLIKLTSSGPVIFVQGRIGRKGRVFQCYKFRTMKHEPNYNTFKQTTYNDSRVTPIGRLLRKTNLDELPQFFNVIKGNMSIVGPRPHAVQHDAEFWFTMPNYQKRYSVLPGITGLAQVRGARGITEHNTKMQHRLRYDLLYIKKCSLPHDIQICWWTLKLMLQGDKNAW